MAIDLTLKKRMYQDPLEKRGVESVELPKALYERLDNEGVYMIQEGARMDEIGDVGKEAIQYLRKQKVDAIVLGCTELPILFTGVDDPDLINPNQLLAVAAVRKALGD